MTMSVIQLIEELKKYPENATVEIEIPNDCYVTDSDFLYFHPSNIYYFENSVVIENN